MASTTLQLVDRVRDLLIEDGSRETFTDVQVIRTALNPIAREIASIALTETDSSTIATVAGQRNYALPAAIVPFIRISSVTYGTSRKPLAWVEWSQMATETTQGEPGAWTIWENQLQLNPIPSAVDTIYIDAWNGSSVAVAQNPAASTDEFQFTADVEDCLVWGSASLLAAINSESGKEQRFGERYTLKLRQLREKLQPDSGPPASIGVEYDEDAFFHVF